MRCRHRQQKFVAHLQSDFFSNISGFVLASSPLIFQCYGYVNMLRGHQSRILLAFDSLKNEQQPNPKNTSTTAINVECKSSRSEQKMMNADKLHKRTCSHHVTADN